VLDQASCAILNYNGTGLGIIEHSHRSPLAANIINETKAGMISYLDTPADYEVLFMQGGGNVEFSATAYNLIGNWVSNNSAQSL
jgi:phosphoserine aminotransferase